MHKCTLAVQLADAKHYGRLEGRHQKNSTAFARFMKQLRNEEAVAIVGKDKHERFGILVPRNGGGGGENSNDYEDIAEYDCSVDCFIGDAKDVLEFLTSSAGRQAPPATVEESSSSSTPWDTGNNNKDDSAASNEPVWQPPTETEDSEPTWQPPGDDDNGGGDVPPWEATNQNDVSPAPWETNNQNDDAPPPWETSNQNEESTSNPWDNPDGGGEGGNDAWGASTENDTTNGNKRSFEDMDNGDGNNDDDGGDGFHQDAGAAAADAFYSGLTRSLDTRAQSRLYHMRSFNGWVKATQIQELDPRIEINGQVQPKGPLRVLDLACGKGGDLTKWTLHERGMENYVGIDVARGSLKDAAIRTRELRKRNKLSKAIFTCADLGADVPGRKKSSKHNHMQKLLTWSLQEESDYESGDPEFSMRRGGGISETDKFDVVSIQFAIHYMMQTKQRARRFFHTVSQLLDIGGNLICTTIDARVVMDHFMNLGLNYHFVEDGEDPEFDKVVVSAGAGACNITFEPDIVKKILTSKSDGSDKDNADLFGLEYTFTLVEGSDHAAGVGDAVNLPEWLIPVPVLEALGKEAGLELEYAQNFHEFFQARKDPSAFAAAHHALYNMKVLNRNGTISKDEWSVSRLYAAIKFRKVRESSVDDVEEEGAAEKDNDGDKESEDEEEKKPVALDPVKAKKLFPMAMMKAKKAVGADEWKNLSSDEKNRLTQLELEKIAAA